MSKGTIIGLVVAIIVIIAGVEGHKIRVSTENSELRDCLFFWNMVPN